MLGLVLAYLRRRPRLFLTVLGADALAQVLSLALKVGVGRDRPPIRYPSPEPLVRLPHDGSFPSGHAASSFACAAILAWAEPRLAAPLYVLAAAIAFSRVYVGVHYPLDVLGGAVLGLLIARALRWLVEDRLRSARATRSG